MLKKILKGIGILLGVVVLLSVISIFVFKPDETVVLDFIKDHPDKAAIMLVRNDTVLAKANAERIMPLASTVKIIVAVEYAIQASRGMIDPDSTVALDELEKYYIPNTDGGAHPSWLTTVQDKASEGSISIREVAKGMIRFSSNANTEWLCERLGVQNINNRLDSLGIEDHTKIYYIVSALFMGKERFPDLAGEGLEKKLKAMSLEEYQATTEVIHEKLKTDRHYKEEVGDLGMAIQKVWSDNLPASTVREYATLMSKINSREYFRDEAQRYLDEVMESHLEGGSKPDWVRHYGKKGGSTAFLLTTSLYASDQDGNKTEMAYFFNNVGRLDYMMLADFMSSFDDRVLTDPTFRAKVEAELGD